MFLMVSNKQTTKKQSIGRVHREEWPCPRLLLQWHWYDLDGTMAQQALQCDRQAHTRLQKAASQDAQHLEWFNFEIRVSRETQKVDERGRELLLRSLRTLKTRRFLSAFPRAMRRSSALHETRSRCASGLCLCPYSVITSRSGLSSPSPQRVIPAVGSGRTDDTSKIRAVLSIAFEARNTWSCDRESPVTECECPLSENTLSDPIRRSYAFSMFVFLLLLWFVAWWETDKERRRKKKEKEREKERERLGLSRKNCAKWVFDLIEACATDDWSSWSNIINSFKHHSRTFFFLSFFFSWKIKNIKNRAYPDCIVDSGRKDFVIAALDIEQRGFVLTEDAIGPFFGARIPKHNSAIVRRRNKPICTICTHPIHCYHDSSMNWVH